MSAEATQRQLRVYDFIVKYIEEHEYPPTVREMCEALKIASPEGVSFHLRALEKKGYIIREPNRSRAIRVRKPNLPVAFPTAIQ
jgi:repressor LexA